jgi:hypothetical protein
MIFFVKKQKQKQNWGSTDQRPDLVKGNHRPQSAHQVVSACGGKGRIATGHAVLEARLQPFDRLAQRML